MKRNAACQKQGAPVFTNVAADSMARPGCSCPSPLVCGGRRRSGGRAGGAESGRRRCSVRVTCPEPRPFIHVLIHDHEKQLVGTVTGDAASPVPGLDSHGGGGPIQPGQIRVDPPSLEIRALQLRTETGGHEI